MRKLADAAKCLSGACCLCVLVACNATHGYRVHHVTNESTPLEVRSVLYALPRTVVTITIPVTKTATDAPPRCTKTVVVKELEASAKKSTLAPADEAELIVATALGTSPPRR
jgi:hypothetical protein